MQPASDALLLDFGEGASDEAARAVVEEDPLPSRPAEAHVVLLIEGGEGDEVKLVVAVSGKAVVHAIERESLVDTLEQIGDVGPAKQAAHRHRARVRICGTQRAATRGSVIGRPPYLDACAESLASPSVKTFGARSIVRRPLVPGFASAPASLRSTRSSGPRASPFLPCLPSGLPLASASPASRTASRSSVAKTYCVHCSKSTGLFAGSEDLSFPLVGLFG